jgi:hypothetical protein
MGSTTGPTGAPAGLNPQLAKRAAGSDPSNKQEMCDRAVVQNHAVAAEELEIA